MSQGSKTDTAVKLVLIFFISLLSFSVGTFVGKQVSDADHRRASLEIEDGHMMEHGEERGVASLEERVDTETAAISDEEVASLTKEFMDAERKTASEGKAQEDAEDSEVNQADPQMQGYSQMNKKEEPKDTMQVTTIKTDTVKTAADRVSENKAPAKDQPAKAKPNTHLPVAVAAASVGKYTVQIGSYADEAEAKAYANKMKEMGYSAFYVPADVKGQTWYRVSVGLYADTKSAEEYRKSLLDKKVVSAAIVQKIVK